MKKTMAAVIAAAGVLMMMTGCGNRSGRNEDGSITFFSNLVDTVKSTLHDFIAHVVAIGDWIQNKGFGIYLA